MSAINRMAIALLLVTLAGTAAFGKTKKKTVIFVDPTTVNGTVLKAGNYDAAFDDVTNELSIIKNGKVVAKTAAHVETRDRKATDTQVRSRMIDNENALLGITFGGSTQEVVVVQAGMQAGGNN